MARLFVALGLLALVCVCFASPLEVSVRVDKTEIIAGEALTARITVLNPTDQDQTVLSWFTPLEGIRSNIFHIVHEESGRTAVYKGMIMKRSFPAPESAFITIAAGQAKHIEVSLSDNYHFLSNGIHKISLVASFNTFASSSVPINASEFDAEVEITSEPHLVVVQSADPSALVTAITNNNNRQQREIEAITYVSCTSTQQSGVQKALPIAQSDATQAYNYLTAAKCSSSYVTWFGVNNSARYNTVKANFQKIVSQLKSNNYKFDCACNDAGVYAYVYPFDPTFTIHLCPAFWTASANSHTYNSRPGTLTHETSHFRAVAGTDDIQYGVLPCQRLATNSPQDAIKNADSYEFFQESNPKC